MTRVLSTRRLRSTLERYAATPVNETIKRRDTMTTAPSIAPAASPGHNAPPDTAFERLREETRRLGSIEGKAEETLTTHFLQVIEAASDGNIDLQRNKHGDRDDAAILAEDYATARNEEVVFSLKKPKHKVAAARTRLMIKFGGAKVGDVVGFVHRAMDSFRKMRSIEGNRNKLKDPSNFMMGLARHTLANKQLPSMADVNKMARKAETEEPTVADVLDSIRKTLVSLRDGKHKAGSWATSNVDTALKALNRDLKAIADAVQPPPQSTVIPAGTSGGP